MQPMFVVHLIGENALVCQFDEPISETIQLSCHSFSRSLQQLPYVDEVVVGMNNITLYFEPFTSPPLEKIKRELTALWQNLETSVQQGKIVEIPVCYGGEYGPDLQYVAQYHRLSIDEIIHLHTAPLYRVYFMGFQPGFPYLGGLNEKLHTPRRETPRTAVPQGSVGIGGSQTGVYPFGSPGGWQLIGRTFEPLFLAEQFPPTKLQAGDQVRFVVDKVVYE